MNASYMSLNQAIHNVSEMANEPAEEQNRKECKAHAALNKNELKSKIVCNFEICFCVDGCFSASFFFFDSDRKQL